MVFKKWPNLLLEVEIMCGNEEIGLLTYFKYTCQNNWEMCLCIHNIISYIIGASD